MRRLVEDRAKLASIPSSQEACCFLSEADFRQSRGKRGPHCGKPHSQPGQWPRIVHEAPSLLEFLGRFRYAVAQSLLL